MKLFKLSKQGIALFLGWVIIGQPQIMAEEMPHSVVLEQGLSGKESEAKRYWAYPPLNSIVKSNLDGSKQETVLSDLGTPYGLAFDKESGLMLWTSAKEELVHSFSNEGRVQKLDTSFDYPYTIISDHDDYKIAYTITKNQLIKITQHYLSEEEKIQVLAVLEGEVHGISLDEKNGLIYLGDRFGRMVKKFDLKEEKISDLLYATEQFPIKQIEEIESENEIRGAK